VPGYGTRRVTDMTIEEQARAYHDEKVVAPARRHSRYLQGQLTAYMKAKREQQRYLGATVIRADVSNHYGVEVTGITLRLLDGSEEYIDSSDCSDY
jgi:hypothetical protein